MLGIRKLSPGGVSYLTGSVSCADRPLDADESLADYYTTTGYPPGQWFGRGAAALGVSGEATHSQLTSLFGEGRHPEADRIEAELIGDGATPAQALNATRLGHRFPTYQGMPQLQAKVSAAYRAHNRDNGRNPGASIDDTTRHRIRQDVLAAEFTSAHGHAPSGNELQLWLRQLQRDTKSATSGWEMVLAAPKSVSVLWALADRPTRELITRVHNDAVRDTLTYFENRVAFTRKGAGGVAQHDVQGVTAASFEHWDSRAGDPHLHTHVLVSTKVQGPDGRWTSLDGRTIYAATVTLSEYYNSRVRDLLRAQGATWQTRPGTGADGKQPVWELDGVPPRLVTGFSTRAQRVEAERARLIVEYRQKHGHEPSPQQIHRIGQLAQYGTRQRKQPPRTLDAHVRRWREQATEMLELPAVGRLSEQVFHGRNTTTSPVDIADLAARTVAVVSAHRSHFSLWNLEAEAHRQSAHLRVADRDRLVGDVLRVIVNDKETVALHAPAMIEVPAALRRSNGESVFRPHRSQRYTTARTLREEAALVAWGRRRDGYRVAAPAVHRAIEGTRLNRGQQRLVRTFATSGQRVALALAPAGAGKTTAMKAYARVWRTSGGRVWAFGPSAKAAQVLGQQIGAAPHTLHQVTTALHVGSAEKRFAFRRGDVLIVDEISMAGTHTLHAVVQYALRRGADVRMVGDTAQLHAVEAGGFATLFAHDIGAVRLNEVVRFSDPRQAAASLELHDGIKSGLDYYFRRGWVQEGSREYLHHVAHQQWRRDIDAGQHALLTVPTNDDVVSLNRAARAARMRGGYVSAERGVPLRDGTAASSGDLVVSRSNDRLQTLFSGRDFVKNGDTWIVRRVRRDGGLVVRHREHGATTVLPAPYVAAHVELAYAATTHRVEGMTSDTAHSVVPQGVTREQLYTLLTRGTTENRMYVETTEHTVDSHRETPVERTAREVLEAALDRVGAETTATEELRTSLSRAESLRTLVGVYNHVARLGAEERIDGLLHDRVPTVLDRPATPALRQTLHTAEDMGWQAEHLIQRCGTALHTARTEGEADPAALLQSRVATHIATHRPPPREQAATQTQLNRWRTLIEIQDRTAAVENPEWTPVWRIASAAADEALDVDSAIIDAGRAVFRAPEHSPMEPHTIARDALVAALHRQRTNGHGWHPALPWLARPHHGHLAADPELGAFLQQLGTAIDDRATELLDDAKTQPPRWASSIGPRPHDTGAAQQHWDELVRVTAAYRETCGVAVNEPTPLGPEPDGKGLRARAWHYITAQWTQHPPGYIDATAGIRPDFASAASPVPPVDDTAPHTTTSTGDTHSTQEGDDAQLDLMLGALHEWDATPRSEDYEEPLWTVVSRREKIADRIEHLHLIDRVTTVLAQRDPDLTLGPAEPALMQFLRDAEHRHGWDAGELTAEIARRGIHGADDPASILLWRARQLVYSGTADRRADQPTPLVSRDSPLPWLTMVASDALAQQPAAAQQLRGLDEAITNRLTQLSDEILDAPAAWLTGSLGERPTEPKAAREWDTLATTAAAYRETYRVTTNTPLLPLGGEPDHDGQRKQAWHAITNGFQSFTADTDTAFTRNTRRLAELRAKVAHADSSVDNTHNRQAAENATQHGDDQIDHGLGRDDHRHVDHRHAEYHGTLDDDVPTNESAEQDHDRTNSQRY